MKAPAMDIGVVGGSMGTREHWDEVYRTRSPGAVSWYRPRLDQSLALIDDCGLEPSVHVADVGGGASTLVDDLLARGFKRVSVADISKEALEHSRARLGHAGAAVRWVVGDATTALFDAGSVELWHDRAVFHFLTDAGRREAYVEALHTSLRPGGYAIIATFDLDGPERCSGLPVARYAPSDIAAALGPDFELIKQSREEHVTPWGSSQRFAYALCQRCVV